MFAGFVAPEVIDGEAHSPAQDMFAVGVMLYITITGRRPMTNRQANTLTYSKFEAWDYPHMHVRPSYFSSDVFCIYSPENRPNEL